MSDRPAHATPALRLEPRGEPPLVLAPIDPNASDLRLGRGQECELFLPDPTVSRLHLALTRRGGAWFARDCGSRHGSRLNGVQLKPDEAVMLADGDRLGIGPWLLIARIGSSADHDQPASGSAPVEARHRATIADSAPDQRILPVSASAARLAAHQLDLLLSCAAVVTSDAPEAEIAQAIVRAAAEGTGFPRAAMLRWDDPNAIVTALHGSDVEDKECIFSRSLLRAASEGRTVQLSDRAAAPSFGQSIVDLDITGALCIPVRVAQHVDCFLYLDDAGAERRAGGESIEVAARFSEALARLTGLGLADRRRAQIESRYRRIETELAAARGTQRLLMPRNDGPSANRITRMTWSLRARPGRFVAGDLFDLLELQDGRIAVIIGDVTGEGVQAGVLMAAAQSYLHALLRAATPLEEAVIALNQYVYTRSSADRFVTLWTGLIDPETGLVTNVDAGHGYWGVRDPGGSVRDVRRRGGIPIGIDPSFVYETETFVLSPEERLILFTDGIIEQPGLDGTAFGIERLHDALRDTTDPDTDAESVFSALTQFSGGDQWADDATFASIAVA